VIWHPITFSSRKNEENEVEASVMVGKIHLPWKGSGIKEKGMKTLFFLSAISAIIVIFSIIFFLFRDAYPIFQK
jgi:ABC-type phosphate transport system permease subunit